MVGITLGLSWSGRLTNSLSYSVGVSGYQYDFESNTDDSPDFSETVFSANAGLVYLF